MLGCTQVLTQNKRYVCACRLRGLFVIVIVFLLCGSAVFAAVPFGRAQDSSSDNIVVSPSSVTMNVGQSEPFTSTIPPNLQDTAQYQWYLNGTAVTGANSPSWAFTSAATGIYMISLGISTPGVINGTSENSTNTS